ncbi:MAG: Peptide deformylase [Candidatus Collierbacteria bacterium GW2011_GWB1_45_35]|uniref:Peptide deformylase n=2 Tax=Candidatus Collieribacteriota TaxID=1752725 RepID=A0A0G1MZR3_9BACT|nr:MAG: Peptide deformylase [Microgenomates group bacterium GW2011_GWC1_44_23]KKT86282.1 MAG: Peptide deformylase [Candidatus Collierbacteria bacterium GW2011_GWA2_44_99]KKT95245.1 MAG: Peptide deformylase [Candidatus Collierbacteria bacterium GW2011_GWA1_45_15]KKT99241.1 MAG: Peptide deformylase [Candidatus Collierbacteria bacterium GW2011_GWB2_45_17]KKU04764.1 MAG: Peptide deformylase [Candidatus Collierbacteria bacterium GW2011_GWB1_45_35]KKU07770.1 MAG: Peptide deformylase [Candidatus Coll
MKILVTPHKFLRITAKPVLVYDKKLEKQISEIITTLKSAKDPEGVGLAATQVGINRRLFIVTLSDKPEIFINPEIVSQSEAMLAQIHPKKKDRWLEGCLSIPGLWGFVDRPYSIKIKYLTPEKGQLVTCEREFLDTESAYIQHENDHLNGVLFTDLILKQGGQIFKDTPDGLIPINKI